MQALKSNFLLGDPSVGDVLRLHPNDFEFKSGSEGYYWTVVERTSKNTFILVPNEEAEGVYIMDGAWLQKVANVVVKDTEPFDLSGIQMVGDSRTQFKIGTSVRFEVQSEKI